MGWWSNFFGRGKGSNKEHTAGYPLVIVPIPPLFVLLSLREKDKGAPLTEEEVLEIRGRAVCMTMRQSHAVALAKSRGYDDLNPERVWEEWCEYVASRNQDV